MSYVLMTLLVATWASLGVSYGDKTPCCAPRKLSLAASDDDGKLLYNLYLDFDNGLALEDWDGHEHIDRILYDMNEKIVYTGLASDGEDACSKVHYTEDKYYQCMPSDAQYYDVPAVDGKEMEGFKFTIGSKNYDLVVTADTCLAQRAKVTFMDGSEVKLNFVGEASIADPTNFDDLVREECTEVSA